MLDQVPDRPGARSLANLQGCGQAAAALPRDSLARSRRASNRYTAYSQPLMPLVRQIEEVGGGGTLRPLWIISCTSSCSASGCAIADWTPTRTKPRAQSSGIHVRPFIAPLTVSRL